MKAPLPATATRVLLAIVLALILPLAEVAQPVTGNDSVSTAQTPPDDFKPGEVLVRFKDGLPPTLPRSLIAAQGLRVKRTIPRFGIHLLAVPEGHELSTVTALRSDARVEYAELNYRIYAPEPRAAPLLQMPTLAAPAAMQVTPDDPLYANWQWNLNNTGQSGGTPDADIDAPEAWDITTGSHEIIIAVLDSGVDLEHPDLADKLWTNPGEIPGNGLDDDGNKKADDVHGWDFVNWDNDPQDDPLGYGTSVAGVAAATTNNSQGIAGVSWGVRIMPLKVLENRGGSFFDVILGINYAVEKGARVINMSFVSSRRYDPLQQVIELAHENYGILFVAMAGDCGDGCFIRETYEDNPILYPAAFDHVIAVGATNQGDEREAFSEWGSYLDVMAPGRLIPAPWWDPSREDPHIYGLFTSTVVAAPHVSGLAALIWSVNPGLSPDEVEDIIKASADQVGPEPTDESGRNDLYGYGRINAETALRIAPHRIDVQPAKLIFLADDERTPACRTVTNPGTNASTWEATTTAKWLRVDGPYPVIPSSGLGLTPSWVDVCVVQENLPDYGFYSTAITATSTLTLTVDNPHAVPVFLSYRPYLSQFFLPYIFKRYSDGQ